MREQLTPQQKAAVENRGGKLLVSAAAGSGKTKVLVDRLLSYLTDPVNPANLDDFLIITYTKAAAAELRGKISDKLTEYIAQHPENRHMQQQVQRMYLAKICTVHAFCADILREHAYKLDISADFRIAEENECQEIMLNTLQQILDNAYSENLDSDSFYAFIDTQGLGRDDRQIPEIILQIYTSALCHLDPKGWLKWCLESSNMDAISDAGETLWGSYLIHDLQNYLRLQIDSFAACIRKGELAGMDKPVTLMRTTMQGLQSLLNCKTWDQIATHPSIEYGTLTFTKEHRGSQLSEQIKAIRNACKDGLPKKLRAFSDTSAVVLQQLKESALAAKGLVELVIAFHDAYGKAKKFHRILDFSDIEQRTLDLFLGKNRTGITSAAEEIGKRYREIMIDEYQDSNEVQDAIFSALTNERQNCFMVGDVKQSIYQFRLADPGIFLKKYQTFKSTEDASDGEGRKVLLTANFRSSGGVISAVNDVFTECMSSAVGGLTYGENEMLREGIPHIPLNDREVELYGIDVQEDTYQEEATFVAQRILELLDGTHYIRQGELLRPITLDDIVILLRSPGSVGGEFRYALECAGIPSTMGNDTDLLQMPEIETLCSILQIIHNPLQDIPLIAAIVSPVFGFTSNDLASIRSLNRKGSFYKTVEAYHSDKTDAFVKVLNELRMQARFLTISQLIHLIFLKTQMFSIYSAMPDGEDKVHNLQNFCQIASAYEATGRKDLTYFLSHLSAMEEKGLSVSQESQTGVVRIMSIHKSKGLEFPVVFLCGLSRNFNTSDSQKPVLCHKELGLGLMHINTQQRVRFPTIAKRAIAAKISQDSISEELRVLYVAMTRARDRLIMTYASSKLKDRFSEIAMRMDISSRELLTAHVSCPGTWILLCALQRTEAGEFFALADRPDCVKVSDMPWKIQVVTAKPTSSISNTTIEQSEELPPEIIDKIRQGLSFQYPHLAATRIPSKITATQLKGRSKDQEAAEFAKENQSKQLDFKMPARKNAGISGTERGNAYHLIMQHINLSKCTCIATIQDEIQRIAAAGYITEQQANAIEASDIFRFFQSDLGNEMIHADHVLREFKFSILEDAQMYYSGINNDAILLQGVIDCAIIQKDGIILLDFKTDKLNADNRNTKIQQYRAQIQSYSTAISRIYEMPVHSAYMYFFSTNEFVEI